MSPDANATRGLLTLTGLNARARDDAQATTGVLTLAGQRASASDVVAPGQLVLTGLVAETWHAVFVSATGELVSVGTVLGALPPGQESIELTGPPADSEMWDEATRTFVARPAKVIVDRADDVLADPELEGLSGLHRAAVRDSVARAFPEELRKRPEG